MATPSLKYYKQRDNVIDPVFATKGSACFDIYSFFHDEQIRLWLDDPEKKQARATSCTQRQIIALETDRYQMTGLAKDR